MKETCKVSAALCPHSNLGLGETPLSHDDFPIFERETALFTSQAFHGNLGANFHIQFSMRDHASDCTAGVCRAMSPMDIVKQRAGSAHIGVFLFI